MPQESVSIVARMELFLTSPAVKSFLAGSLSGTCSTILFQPLDLVKTRLQTSFGTKAGVVSTIQAVIAKEKLMGLWKGVAPSLSRTVPGIGIYFCSLHSLKSHFSSNDPSPLQSVCLGAVARSISGVCILPITVIKTRFESGRFNYSSMTQALNSIYKQEGARGLFSGMSATLLRDAPFSGLYLMFYAQAKKAMKEYGHAEQTNALHHFTCGIVAGAFASLVTQPADVVKTKMQLYPEQHCQVYSVILYVYNEHGLQGFLRGVVPRTLRRTLMAAMAWTVYEQVMSTIGIK